MPCRAWHDVEQHAPDSLERRGVSTAAANGSEDPPVRPGLGQRPGGHGGTPTIPDQVGQECGGMPGLDETGVQDEITGLVAHVRLETGLAAGVHSPCAGGCASRFHDPGMVGEPAQRRLGAGVQTVGG